MLIGLLIEAAAIEFYFLDTDVYVLSFSQDFQIEDAYIIIYIGLICNSSTTKIHY